MNVKEIREMVKLMNDNDLVEIELEREGTKIKLKKFAGELLDVMARPPLDYHPVSQPPAPVVPVSEVAVSDSSNAQGIKSPMVGTFYRSPSPDASSFVDVGQIVEVGQVVCIVEAMKLMNEIKSEIRGRITAIPVENAQPVEFGQTLFTIESV